jgi:hypothetical protein
VENGFQVYFWIGEIYHVGPACRSLSCCVPRPEWLSWAAFLVATRVIITRYERALSEAATPVVWAQRRDSLHRTRISASAPSRLPVASHHRLLFAAEASIHHRCPSVPRHRASILRSAQRLVSVDERCSAGWAASMLELHLRRAASTSAKSNSDVANFSGDLQSPPSRRHSESSVTSRATDLLVDPALSYRPEPPHRAPWCWGPSSTMPHHASCVLPLAQRPTAPCTMRVL